MKKKLVAYKNAGTKLVQGRQPFYFHFIKKNPHLHTREKHNLNIPFHYKMVAYKISKFVFHAHPTLPEKKN
jgi:hypothetical protein